MRILSIDPSVGNAHSALWADGVLLRVRNALGYSLALENIDLFVTEQMTVFNMAGARALIQVAYDAGLRAGPYAHREVPCVALTAAEWRAELGIQPAHRARTKREVDADVREACAAAVPGLDAILAHLRGPRGKLAQDAYDCVAIGLATHLLIARWGCDQLVGHCQMPRDLRNSNQLPK